MKFQITRPSGARNVSGKFTGLANRGQPMGAHASDDESFAYAAGTNFIGFVTRPVTADGDVLTNHVWPGRIESDFKSGGYVSLEKADEVEVAGAAYIMNSGLQAISADTAVGTQVSFASGRFAAKGESDIPYFTLTAQLGNDGDGDFTIRLEKVGP